MALSVVSLPAAPPERLAAAVQSALSELPSAAVLKTGAEDTIAEREGSAAIAFQSLVELAYLAASADGLAEAEREMLATLLAKASGLAVDREVLMTHFRDLDAAAEMLGRRERLGRVAADLVGERSGDDVIGFVALVAMADGQLADQELGVLNELGEHFNMNHAAVRGVIDRVAGAVGSLLR